MADRIDVLFAELLGWLPTVLVRMILQYIMKDDGRHFTPLRESLARELDWWIISVDECKGVLCDGETQVDYSDSGEWERERVRCQVAPPRVLLNTDYFYVDGESADQWRFRSMSAGATYESTAIGLIPPVHVVIVRYHATRDDLESVLGSLSCGGIRFVVHDASGANVTREYNGDDYDAHWAL